MPERAPLAELNEDFSTPGATARPWAEVDAVLSNAEIFWLSTTRGDGRPHVTPLPAIWLDGSLHICTGAHEQKAKNLAADPRCALTTGSDRMNTGLDVVVEGTAERVTERPMLVRLAERWKIELDWDFEVGEHAFRDGADRDGLVYAIAPTKVLAFGKGEPFSQTRYRFDR
jgi:general stress protein 26